MSQSGVSAAPVSGMAVRQGLILEPLGRGPEEGDTIYTEEPWRVTSDGDWADVAAQLIRVTPSVWSKVDEDWVLLELTCPATVYLDFCVAGEPATAEAAWLTKANGWRRIPSTGITAAYPPNALSSTGESRGPGAVFARDCEAGHLTLRGSGCCLAPALLVGPTSLDIVVVQPPVLDVDGSLAVTCTGLSGEELQTLRCDARHNVADFRDELAQRLRCSPWQLQLVASDTRPLAFTEPLAGLAG